MSSRSPGSKDTSPPADLPDYDHAHNKRRFEDPIEDLPSLPTSKKVKRKTGIDKGRHCPTCGAEARIVSNHNGIRAFCGPCKTDWPISMMPLGPTLPMTSGRGMSKMTIVEPSWDLAYANLDEDDFYKRSDD